MKKSILSIIAVFAVGISISSCSSDQSVKESKAEMKDAKEDLEKAKMAYEQEVADYRNDVAEEVQINQDRIDQLKAEKLNLQKDARLEREARINELEKRNNLMKAKMQEYKYETKENWENFKRELKHDMKELGNAFKDIGSDNVKDN